MPDRPNLPNLGMDELCIRRGELVIHSYCTGTGVIIDVGNTEILCWGCKRRAGKIATDFLTRNCDSRLDYVADSLVRTFYGQ